MLSKQVEYCHMMSQCVLISALVVTLLSFSEGRSKYFVSRTLGADHLDCGSLSSPCATVNYALNLTFILVNNADLLSTDCYTGEETSLNIMLLDGDHVIDPVCLTDIHNFSITGMGPTTGVRSSVLGNTYGILAFFNCDNVRINNITFIDSVIGRSSIYAQNTTELHIEYCDIPVYANGALAVWLYDPYGNNYVRNVKFYSIPTLVAYERLTPSTALLITIGRSSDSTGLLYETTNNPIPSDIQIHNCTFEKIVSNDPANVFLGVDDYRRSSDRSKVVQILLRTNSVGNKITFVDCVFQDNKNNIGSTVVSRIGDESSMNSIEFRNCLFQNNLARFGGGIATYFVNNAEYNNITIADCTFSNNEAVLEGGGVFMVTLVPNPQSNLLHIKDCVFYQNSAFYGASVFLFNNPSIYQSSSESLSSSLMVVRITDALLRNNTALLTEGIINTLRIQLEMNGEK